MINLHLYDGLRDELDPYERIRFVWIRNVNLWPERSWGKNSFLNTKNGSLDRFNLKRSRFTMRLIRSHAPTQRAWADRADASTHRRTRRRWRRRVRRFITNDHRRRSDDCPWLSRPLFRCANAILRISTRYISHRLPRLRIPSFNT